MLLSSSVLVMSCIRFSTPAQMKQLRQLAPSMLTREQAASLHPAPAVTESKIRRLRILARDPNPKIRESVASSHHAPADVLAALARDADDGVRACLARNEHAPIDLLRLLCSDRSEAVRGWVAVNARTPADAVHLLGIDSSQLVHRLLEWREEFVRG
ncbi:hypothetical protein GCM10027057_07770 [Marisediminicola antarctica]